MGLKTVSKFLSRWRQSGSQQGIATYWKKPKKMIANKQLSWGKGPKVMTKSTRISSVAPNHVIEPLFANISWHQQIPCCCHGAQLERWLPGLLDFRQISFCHKLRKNICHLSFLLLPLLRASSTWSKIRF